LGWMSDAFGTSVVDEPWSDVDGGAIANAAPRSANRTQELGTDQLQNRKILLSHVLSRILEPTKYVL
jgi:hypothetical protein